jgi:type VI secretion system secreted protein Hcp
MTTGDMFMRVEASRSGAIQGESTDDRHRGEIVVRGWSCGMHSPAGAGSSAGPTGRTSFDALRITKRPDSASTKLMAALRDNEILREVVLSVRRPGPQPLDHLVVVGQMGRVVELTLATGPDPEEPLVESLAFVFARITVEYRAQDETGRPGTGSSFTAETRQLV